MTLTSERRSANHWPGLDVLPTGPRARVSARIARTLFLTAVNRLDVTVHIGDQTYGRGGPVMVISRPDEFFLRLGRDQLIGFGEAYLTGAWDAEDLDGFLAVLAARMQHLIPEPLQKLRSLVVRKPPEEELSSIEHSRDNIAHHYDLSNELFELFLDPTLSYSSALFPPDQLDGSATAQDLEAAQVRKIERLLDQAGVTEGSRVLEIGSGWGELAIRAARRGATVRTITLSTEQKALADERIAAAGFSDQVVVDLCDYRDVSGEYDAVVSVEMIEAVGWQFWPTYFETIDRVLAPRGRVAIQAITMPHDRMLVTRNTYTWINKYIFPGGFLPSVKAIDEITRRHTGLRLVEGLSMGASYAETLRLWDQTFLAASGPVLDLGFDEIFLRMWHFYLKYSQAGFASGYLDVNQLDLREERMTATDDTMAEVRGAPATSLEASEGVAPRLAEALRPFLHGDLPVRLRAWDGSEAGPADAPLVVLNSADAVRRLLWRPGELGAAQAYVTGEIDVPGDLDVALTHAFAVAKERGLSGSRPSMAAVVQAIRTVVGLGALGRPPAAPASQAKLRGRLHSQLRDRSAISFHYDLSNEFYAAILEPQMAYSCGYHATPDVPVEQAQLEKAQLAKLDLVCRKLGLEPGMTLLDVGCGWGSMSLHAAEQFGAQVTGITIAAEQKKFIDARIRERGLEDRVTIKLCDYRDAVGEYDAVSSIEMGEHVGQDNYPTYAEVLHRSVKPGGRVLVQQMSRTGKWPGGGPFIEHFIAPDMYMRPVGETVAFFEKAGLEVRDVHGLREHYVLTVAGWLANFNRNRERLVEMMGEEVVRVWELYLVGGSMAFRDGRMGVDQILMVRPGAEHTLPLVREW